MYHDIVLYIIIFGAFVYVMNYALKQEASFAASSFGIVPTVPPNENCSDIVGKMTLNSEDLFANVIWMRSVIFAMIGTAIIVIVNRNMKSTSNLFYAFTLFVILFFLMTQSYAYYQMHVLAPFHQRVKRYHEEIGKRQCIDFSKTLPPNHPNTWVPVKENSIH